MADYLLTGSSKYKYSRGFPEVGGKVSYDKARAMVLGGRRGGIFSMLSGEGYV